MSDAAAPPSRPKDLFDWRARRNDLAASHDVQRWASQSVFTRRAVRRQGEAMLDLMAGFVHTQVLRALVETGTLDALRDGPIDTDTLAVRARIPNERMEVLLNAGAALNLLVYRKDEKVDLTLRGAALNAVPGITGMIRHHATLYEDLSDPVAFFRGETQPALAQFWPYVFSGQADAETAKRYSELMSETQTLVADETLAALPLTGIRHLMDVGGGAGTFLAAVAGKYADLTLSLVDLPEVAALAERAFAEKGRTLNTHGLNFRADPLPRGADCISLVRVLYDHSDATVAALLQSVWQALPPGGQILISEPMAGGSQRPNRSGDAYFAIYTLAMETGRTRTPKRLHELLAAAGFEKIRQRPTTRPFITSVMTAHRPLGTE